MAQRVGRGRWVRGTLLGVFLGLGGTPLRAQAPDTPRIEPGSRVVMGTMLQHFTARWQERQLRDSTWVDASNVAEELVPDPGASRLRFRRSVDAGAWGFDIMVEMDRETLAPISLVREVRGDIPAGVIEQLTSAGVTRRFEYRFSGSRYTARHTTFGGQTTEDAGDFGRTVFDATTAGLLLAALPLEAGYRAELPVVFVQTHDGSHSQYVLRARVVDVERMERADAPRYQVEVDWIDPETGAVTSAGGAEEPGGAYWIVREPTHDGPHVPRYRNNTVDFILLDSSDPPKR